MRKLWPILALLGCFGSDAYIVEGTVVEVTGHRTLTVDHQEIEGFMPAMVMDFEVADRALLKDVKAGDKILFGQYAGSTVKLDGEELLIMNESEVFGVIE